jgi:hypothetical protein
VQFRNLLQFGPNAKPAGADHPAQNNRWVVVAADFAFAGTLRFGIQATYAADFFPHHGCRLA